MTVSISLHSEGFPQFRHDTRPDGLPAQQIFSIGTGVYRCYLQISDFFYEDSASSLWSGINLVDFPNRSQVICPATVYELLDSTWSGGGSQTVVGTKKSVTFNGSVSTGIARSAALSATYSRFQCYPTANLNPTYTSMFFQNSGAGVQYDAANVSAIHAMKFSSGNNIDVANLGIIYELGVKKGQFLWYQGDAAVIELDNGVVKYFIARANGTMILLRTIKSKLTVATAPLPIIGGFGTAGAPVSMVDILVCINSKASMTFESIGVLENFQDWQNEAAISSTAEAIEMADNNPQFTYPNHKKRLRSIQANLNMRSRAQRLDYVDFFNHHGTEIEFIYADKARKDREDHNLDFWARFASPFGDKLRASCLSMHGALITESYRNDYVAPPNSAYNFI